MGSNSEQKKNFEEQLQELEEIVKELENGDLTLEQSLSKFQRGVELYKDCNKLLNESEGKVKLLLEKQNGQVGEEDFKADSI